MSQSSFLEDVVCWTTEECQQRAQEAVPKLICYFNEADNYHGEIGILKVLCQCFVPCMEWVDLEKCIFREISKKTCDSFSHIMEDVKGMVSERNDSQVRESIEGLFELLLDILDCVEGSVKYIQGGGNPVELCNITSLCPLTTHLLKETFNHCKESGEIYNDLIASLSEPLSILFRKAYSLLMSYLNLLDRITVGYDCSDKDVEELTAVCEGLYRISQLVTSFDIKIAITLWKAISRYVTQHKVLLRDRLDLAGMVTYLCAEIQRGYTYLFTIVPVLDENGQPLSSQGDEKAFLKSVKILGFQMKVLVMLVKEYEGYLADCERPIYILLLHLYRMQPPGLSAPSLFRDHQEEIERQLINATEPVLFHLLGCDRFITCLTSDDTGGSEDLALSHLILQVIVLGLLPTLSDDIQNKWLIPSSYTEDEPRDGIIDAVFASFEKCHREILMGGKLPGVMCSGKAQRFVSLYEHVCTRLCGYVATLSTIQFGLLESCLLQHVVSVDPLAAQLAMDVWCFVTRYGSAELCLSQVSLLCETVRLCGVSQCPEYRRLLQLVGRLVKFMAPEHQEKLLTLCPFKENCLVWSCLPLSEISSVVRAKIMKEIVPQCTDAMRRWIEADPKQMSLLKHVNDRLEVLCNVASTDGIQEEGGLQELIDCHCKMWSCLPDMREPSCLSSVCSTTYRLQIKLGGYLLPSFSNAALFQVLKAATLLLNEGIPVDLKLTICHFLQRCGQQRLPPSFEQAQILSLLPRLFHPLLTDCCELVQHSACQAVAAFATRHPSVVEESLQSNPGLQEKVFRYIQKDGVFGLSNTDKVALFSSQKETLEKFKNLTVEDRLKLPPLFQPISSQESSMADFSGDDIFCDLLDSKSEEPAPKKLKLDTEKNEVPVSTEYADLLVTTQKAVERWIDIFKSGSVPSSILDGVRKTAEDLSKVVASQNDHGR